MRLQVLSRLASKRALRVLFLASTLMLIFCTLPQTQLRLYSSTNAYVFYATQDIYACSILINVFTLRHTLRTESQILILVSDDISGFYHEQFEALDATVIRKSPPPLHPNSISYYDGCLLKLLAFDLFEDDEPSLDRIIVMDSDQLILRDLEPIFGLSATAGISAPKAYWIDNHTYSSTLMVFRPSQALWNVIKEAVRNIPADVYDMDVINDKFHGILEELPATYGTLNSHWEDNNVPAWFRSQGGYLDGDHHPRSAPDEDLRELFGRVHVLHFTAVGKPWMYDVAQLKAMRPWAHPILVEQWAFWRASALQLCSPGTIDHV